MRLTFDRFSIFLAATFVAMTAACSGPATSTCVPGATMACLCVGGASGVQSCLASGTFGACQCVGVDGGSGSDVAADTNPGVDVLADTTPVADVVPDTSPGTDGSAICPAPLSACSGRCVDTSTDEANCGGCGGGTHTCATGSFCVAGSCQSVSTCPTPFVMCGSDCIDPRSDAAHCGATGDCAGTHAGAACGGACLSGHCVAESCSDVLRRGLSTGDGLYLVDVDGTGPIAPENVYCDMTTAGGGWTLVYKIRNDIPDIADPWWGMVDLGSGDAFPTAPSALPSGTHFDGATRETRSAYQGRSLAHGAQYRGTLVSTTGTVVLDTEGQNGGIICAVAAGYQGTPVTTYSCGSDSSPAVILAAAASTGFSAGDVIYECYTAGPGADLDYIHSRAGSTVVTITGDSTIAEYGANFANSTTLFWLRDYMP